MPSYNSENKYTVFEIKLDNGEIKSHRDLDDYPISVEQQKKSLENGEVVYIYSTENFEKVYVGRTNSFNRRHKEHLAEKNSIYTSYVRCYIILIQQGNKTNTEYLEHELIKYLDADFESTNRELMNVYPGNVSNFEKENNEIFRNVFSPLWNNELNKENLTSDKSLAEIRESIIYKYSPFNELSEEQEDILNNIISSSDKNHIVFGDSGTGKTLLFVKLAFEINNIHPNDKIAMITSSNLIGDIKRIIKNLDLKNKIDIFTSGQFIKRKV